MDAGRELGFQYAPAFAVLLVRRHFLAMHPIAREQERHGHVVLKCIADEVEQLVLVPRRLPLMTLESFPRLFE
jgi:hypothetical protein